MPSTSRSTSAVQVGHFVELHGLAKAPVYNGITGVVVSAPDAQHDHDDRAANGRFGVQLLDHAEGWSEERPDARLEVAGKVLAVKPSNLKESLDSKHWRIAQQPHGMTLYERIVCDAEIAPIDSCDVLAQKVWDSFFETIPAMPLTIDYGFEMRKEILEIKGHKMVWLALDAIQHHLIIEKCRGRYRIFHSCVKESILGGFTARDWCRMDSNSDLYRTRVHKTFGGGRTVGDTEINQLLEWIKELQAATKDLIPVLLQHVGGGIDTHTAALVQRDPSSLSEGDFQLASNAVQQVLMWSHTIRNLIGPLGLTTLDMAPNGTILGDDDTVTITQRDRILFQVPKQAYQRVRELYLNLTGQTYLTPAVFVFMANSGIWWENKRNPADGGAFGFAVRLASLDEILTEEQGVQAAQQKCEHVRKVLGTSSLS